MHRLQEKMAELDKVTQYLNGILDHISQGILFVDLEGTITTYNAAAEKILGVSAEKALFHPFWSHFSDDQLGFPLKEGLKTQELPETSFATLTTPHGTRELQIHASLVIKTAEEGARGAIILIRDVSKIRHLQAIADRNSRMKEIGETVALITHEIRNPLGGIKGFASLLQHDLADRPEQQKLATHIVEGADALNALLTNILDYSRPLQIEPEKIDLITLIQEQIEAIQADSNLNRNITINFEKPQTELPLPLDPHLLKSALLNLMVNAIQAMPEGGTLTLRLEKNTHFAHLQVGDTGEGIPSDLQKKIFTPFFTTKFEGNGFGLAEVHRIIQAHNGTITVTSQENKGTTFTIKLPLKEYPLQGNHRKIEESAHGH